MGATGEPPVFGFSGYFPILLIVAWIAPLFKILPRHETKLTDYSPAAGFGLPAYLSWTAQNVPIHGNAYFTGFGNSKRIVFSTPC